VKTVYAIVLQLTVAAAFDSLGYPVAPPRTEVTFGSRLQLRVVDGPTITSGSARVITVDGSEITCQRFDLALTQAGNDALAFLPPPEHGDSAVYVDWEAPIALLPWVRS
jgi:hypothetical protein